jgi:hypothetical protein
LAPASLQPLSGCFLYPALVVGGPLPLGLFSSRGGALLVGEPINLLSLAACVAAHDRLHAGAKQQVQLALLQFLVLLTHRLLEGHLLFGLLLSQTVGPFFECTDGESYAWNGFSHSENRATGLIRSLAINADCDTSAGGPSTRSGGLSCIHVFLPVAP